MTHPTGHQESHSADIRPGTTSERADPTPRDPAQKQQESETSREAGGIVMRTAGMKHLVEQARRAAQSDDPVLLTGEVGSGRALLARFIHDQSKRAPRSFCIVSCGLRPVERLEGELFGQGGAPGKLRLAQGGTLLLEEIADLPLELPDRLLDALAGEGGRDVRLVATTSRSLRAEVERGRFNPNLLYGLRVLQLFVPPLRDRSGDIELIARHLLAKHNRTYARQISSISQEALGALESFAWPGNVRELDNAIRYAFVMGDGPILMEGDLPPDVRGEDRSRSLRTHIPPDSAARLPNEARRILRALERAGGNRERAAASLGMSRVTLWRKLKAYELEASVQPRRRGS